MPQSCNRWCCWDGKGSPLQPACSPSPPPLPLPLRLALCRLRHLAAAAMAPAPAPAPASSSTVPSTATIMSAASAAVASSLEVRLARDARGMSREGRRPWERWAAAAAAEASSARAEAAEARSYTRDQKGGRVQWMRIEKCRGELKQRDMERERMIGCAGREAKSGPLASAAAARALASFNDSAKVATSAVTKASRLSSSAKDCCKGILRRTVVSDRVERRCRRSGKKERRKRKEKEKKREIRKKGRRSPTL